MKIELKCKKPIALDSPDYLVPLGTSQDNSRNYRFNKKIYSLFPKKLKVLDLGCSGGGFIKDCIDDGYLSVGLEGSDISRQLQRAEWNIIPNFLFTCDITQEFEITNESKPLDFEVITMWEVMEHIHQRDINGLIKNVKRHLTPNGLFIMSVTNSSDKEGGIERHQTRKPKEWWIKRFEKESLFERKELYKYFNNQYIRGRKADESNFHIILSLKDKKVEVEELNLKERLKDLWVGSRVQIILSYLINGRVEKGG